MTFKYTLLFLEDLAAIKSYIALDSPMYAEKVGKEIEHFCESELTTFPHRVKILENNPEMREVPWPYAYTIRFSIENGIVYFHMVYKWQDRKY